MNKTVLITGASRGIGASTARIFASNNYNVIINYNTSEEEAINLSKELQDKYNIETLVIKCDISKKNEVIDMIEMSIKKFECIDVLVNNAGISIDTTFEDKNVENFRKI